MTDRKNFEALELADEEWRPAPSCPHIYEVSSLGRLRRISNHQQRILGRDNGRGTIRTTLWDRGKKTTVAVHREVAGAFLPGTGEEVNHKNGNRKDNRVSNLEWCSKSHNENHSRYTLGNLIRPVVSVHATTGETVIFPSVRSAERYGFCQSHIQRVMRGETYLHQGRRWERLQEHHLETLTRAIKKLGASNEG